MNVQWGAHVRAAHNETNLSRIGPLASVCRTATSSSGRKRAGLLVLFSATKYVAAHKCWVVGRCCAMGSG